MSYAFSHDVPADEQMYRQVKHEIGEEQPRGLVLHVTVRRDGGLRHIDVWESKEDWERFRDERVHPAVGRVLAAAGIDPGPQPGEQELQLVDVWMGG